VADSKQSNPNTIMPGSGDETMLQRQVDMLRSNLASMASRMDASIALMSAVSDITTVPLRAENLHQAATQVLDVLVRSVDGLANCSILLFDERKNLLTLLAARGQAEFFGERTPQANRELVFKLGQGVAGNVFADRKPIFWDTNHPDQELPVKVGVSPPPTSLACLPLSPKDHTIGVLNLSFGQALPFDHPRQRNLILLSMVVANVMQTHLLRAELNNKAVSLAATVKNLENEIDERELAERALRTSEANLARSQQIARVGYWELDLDNSKLLCSDEIFRMFGVPNSSEPLTIDNYMQSVHCDDRPQVEKLIKGFGTITEPFSLEHRIVRPGGEVRVINILGEIEAGQGGGDAKVVGAVQDVTERHEYESKMRLMGSIFENTIEGIFIADGDERIHTTNQSFCNITGFSEDEAVGHTPAELGFRLQDDDHPNSKWSMRNYQSSWQGEVINQRKNGETYPAWATLSTINDARGSLLHYVGIMHDLSDVRRNEEQIIYQAYHDTLTDLPNRHLFTDRLSVAIAHARRTGDGLSVLFLDLDHFKDINDSMGHAVGDVVLKKVAKVIADCVRVEDTVARLGGDEFIVLLQGTQGSDYPINVAERILEALTQPIRVNQSDFYISASVGITLFPHDGLLPETLISNADLAMYRAKKHGRNTYMLFTPSMNVEMLRRMNLDNQMRKALKHGEFHLLYQPKVETATGKVAGLEALLRWQRDGEGTVSPADFIPLAEETGIIVPLGQWVLGEACRQAKAWHDEGFDGLEIAVNISPRQFQQKNLVSMVQQVLHETSLQPNCLELEITENAVMYSVESAIQTLIELKELGVRLSMDDFGRGYSSLYYLKRFPIDTLKIDRAFVRDIPDSEEDAAIVRTVINMSRSLKLAVVAEGVETDQQLAFLCEHHCDQVQGFLLCHPKPADDISNFLSERLSAS
jgi:diguanylate cyclase (GGDEF)-like protein/PAS domain S-box-containing protein